MYVIRGPKGWVAKPGLPGSYTTDLRMAQKFSSRDEANRSRCDNESVQGLESLLAEFRR